MGNRSVEQIRADLAANRSVMANAAGEAVESLKPQNIAREGVAQVKQFAKAEFDAATLPLKDEQGGWQTNKLLILGGAVLGVVVFAVTLNSIATRRSISVAARRAIEK